MEDRIWVKGNHQRTHSRCPLELRADDFVGHLPADIPTPRLR